MFRPFIDSLWFRPDTMVTAVETLLPLILICSFTFADSVSSIMALRGDRVTLTCNTTNMTNTQIAQVIWYRGKYYYTFSGSSTLSNFTDRFVIDPKFPPSLSILNFQENDTGIYKCDLSHQRGLTNIIWNITLKEKHKAKAVRFSLPVIFIYILSTMGGLLLICTSAVCLCRFWRTSNQPEEQSQTDGALRRSEGSAPLDGAGNQYMERQNSIYGLR